MKALCEAMEIEPKLIENPAAQSDNDEPLKIEVWPSPTDEAFLWRVLTYMMQREDWGKFLNHAAEEFYLFQVDWSLGDFMRWLLNPARFVGLCDEWCREHGGWDASV